MHDVHSAQYRCKASNAVGQIISGAVHVNAGMTIGVSYFFLKRPYIGLFILLIFIMLSFISTIALTFSDESKL